MTVKVYLVDDTAEVFETNNYKVSKIKDFHPVICGVAIYDNGTKIFHKQRRFVWFYKNFTFKSKKIQNLLKSLAEAEQKSAETDIQETPAGEALSTDSDDLDM